MSRRCAHGDHRRAHACKWADGLKEELDPEAPPCPAGLELVRQAEENPIDKGFALPATIAGAEVPRLVAAQAVGKGLPITEADDLVNMVLLVLGAIVGKRAASLGINGHPSASGRNCPLLRSRTEHAPTAGHQRHRQRPAPTR
jgi:hypothetical protein